MSSCALVVAVVLNRLEATITWWLLLPKLCHRRMEVRKSKAKVFIGSLLGLRTIAIALLRTASSCWAQLRTVINHSSEPSYYYYSPHTIAHTRRSLPLLLAGVDFRLKIHIRFCRAYA